MQNLVNIDVASYLLALLTCYENNVHVQHMVTFIAGITLPFLFLYNIVWHVAMGIV